MCPPIHLIPTSSPTSYQRLVIPIIINYFATFFIVFDYSTSEEDNEDGEVQLITEVWIEPQTGESSNCSPRSRYLEGLTFDKVPQAVRDRYLFN